MIALLISGACANRPPSPTETEALLQLTSQLIEASEPEQRRALTETQRLRYEADPSYANLLRLTLVRAFDAALAADLQEVRADLQVLAGSQGELVPEQRHIALLVLKMVDDRLRMGAQISNLQQQIDSLTEIEASLNQDDVQGPGEPAP